MASAVVSDSQEHPHPHPHPPHLSLSIDTPPSASPFPSPSSSFLPPPIPGAHEFAMKPAPSGKRRSPRSRTASEEGAVDEQRPQEQNANGRIARDAESPGPTTPRPFLAASPGTPPSATTPTAATHTTSASASASASTSTSTAKSPPAAISTANPPSTPTLSAPSTPSAKRVSFPPPAPGSESSVPSSSRPAPPSPALSRRASAVPGALARSPSSSSSRGSASRRTSRVLAGARHRLSMSTTAADLSLASSAPPSPAAKPPIAIRDFAFPSSDARFAGGGPDVPPACDPARLARRLRGEEGAGALSDWEDEGAEDDGDGFEDGGFLLGRGRMTFGPSSSTNDDRDGGDGVGPADFARNFVDDGLYYEEAYDGDAGGEGDGEGEGVEPGLYRAQFAFKAEDAAEMGLAEGQLVHVLGGGAAGWAVARQREPAVVSGLGLLEVHRRVGARGDAGAVWSEMWAEAVAAGAGAGAAGAGAGVGERRALVPESYLVLVRGEGEREEDALERLERYIEWVESERLKQEAELAAEAEGHARTEADSPSSSDYEDAVEGAGA